ncbi:NAD(P) transhydrogenase [Spirochaetota bacterium]|nr:NAD(P) transhydrogenase [Spirochaetota bacterium]
MNLTEKEANQKNSDRKPDSEVATQSKQVVNSTQKSYDYDFIVIGTGPAGEGASMMASKSNQRVLAIERFTDVGGGCTHWGTIPSKSVRQSIIAYLNLSKIPYLGREFNLPIPKFNQFLNMASTVIESQVKMRRSFYTRNNVTIRYEEASFVDNHKIALVNASGNKKYVTGENIVIASGSRPMHPSNIDFSHPRILDSDKVLKLKETPSAMAIYGAGVVGCEYASIFNNLGLKVDLINSREHVLDFLDTEISDALNYHMREQGITIRNGETFESVEPHDDQVIINLTSGKKIKAPYLLWTQGRVANVKNLNLEAAGITVNDKGIVPVNELYQTCTPNIFAAGDVIGWPSLAGVAYDQGRSLVATNLKIKGYYFLPHYIPTGIYTTPEISFIGKTERELTQEKLPYEVGVANFKNLAKAQILGDNVGILKILFHRQTMEILGVHCFGRQASEIIHIGQAIMSQEKGANTLAYFLSNTFNYPSMAEAYRLAALNGINRL